MHYLNNPVKVLCKSVQLLSSSSSVHKSAGDPKRIITKLRLCIVQIKLGRNPEQILYADFLGHRIGWNLAPFWMIIF